MKKPTARAQQAITTKNKIYECGVQLIKEQGFDAVTIDQIAKMAGVSVGTYYYYFESKMELLREIFNRVDAYFLEEVESQLSEKDSCTQILEFFDHYAIFSLQDGLQMTKKLYTSENKMFSVEGRGMQKVLSRFIQKGLEEGCLKSHKSVDELTRIFFIMARGVTFEWCLHEGGFDLRSVMKSSIETVIEGIRSENL